ncbi:MAG TPA: methyltransferase domain-containing protein [Ktedonobacterales bacterium]|nr:methyltransferase domain-containing protein [Ktedonobacterales bacterium]
MLTQRNATISEMMDNLAQDDAALRRSLADIRRINTILGWRRYAVSAVAWRVRESGARSFSLLDLASGSADIPLAIADWARRAGIAAHIVVSDIHPVMLAVAREQTRNHPNVTVERCDALAPHYDDGSFDIALCTLALHHFAPEDATHILRAMARVGKRVLVFDLARARLAYLGALAMTRGLRMDPITRFDAPASVRRAYTVAELRALAHQAGLRDAHISMRFPFRLALDAPGVSSGRDNANG